jgi:hypothetical protein
VLAVVGVLLFYARTEIVDETTFADHAVEALKDDQVRDVAPTEMVVQLVENRGTTDSPLLMLNHWADVFPPRRSANADFQTRKELLGRAHECARKRGLPVNLIAVDHYDQGELIDSVGELNRERIAAAKR